jgi:Phosphotransferase enzyme family
VNGQYVGHLSPHDPLYPFLGEILSRRGPSSAGVDRFRVFRLHGAHEVYCYQEKHSNAMIVCKFFGPRFPDDPQLARLVAQQEYDNLNTLRGYNLVGSPHHVVQPLGLGNDINAALAVEFYPGEVLTTAIWRMTQHGEDTPLFLRLTALAHFLFTQHERTMSARTVNFDLECDYFDSIVLRLTAEGRIGPRELDELSSLRDAWRHSLRMWSEMEVWLHGDATPGNFLFGPGMDVAAIDLERMRRGDRAFDLGRVAAELQHAFMVAVGRKSPAEPFIHHFFREYSEHFVDSRGVFAEITSRTPYYMGLNCLRIARNRYVDAAYGERLIRQAKRLLKAA